MWNGFEHSATSLLCQHVHHGFVGILQEGLTAQTLYGVIGHSIAKYDDMFHLSEKLDICNRHDVGKHTGCSYCGSGTVALNEHRVFLVAFGSEQYDVI